MTDHENQWGGKATVSSLARLSRGIAATWWYTASAVVAFEVLVVFLGMVAFGSAELPTPTLVALGIGGLVWCASTLPQLLDYRYRSDAEPVVRWRRVVVPVLIAVAYGIIAGALSGAWAVALLPAAQAVALLNWPSGVRARVVLAVTLVLVTAVIVDSRVAFAEGGRLYSEADLLPLGFFAAALPAMTVTSLWWWDVVIALDRVRASEARFAATQERLRVATDVHDLQGHHLQVIALQLELAERLISREPDAALDQIRAARVSVDEARQGTRDLATRFRSVPLSDELANAADLLGAAGTHAEVTIDPDAESAPADVLGPVIRETTTNILRHGGGRWARLSLTSAGDAWRYEIANDVDSDAPVSAAGSGIDGLTRRVAEAGGALEVVRGAHDFALIVTLPGTRGDVS